MRASHPHGNGKKENNSENIRNALLNQWGNYRVLPVLYRSRFAQNAFTCRSVVTFQLHLPDYCHDSICTPVHVILLSCAAVATQRRIGVRLETMECGSERSSVVKLRYRIETVGENEIAMLDRDSDVSWCLLQRPMVTVRDLVVSWCFLQNSKVNVHGEV